jgi:hypothetical protein
VPGDSDPTTHLLPVVSQRNAVDILDALADRPRSFAELRDRLRARRRELDWLCEPSPHRALSGGTPRQEAGIGARPRRSATNSPT